MKRTFLLIAGVLFAGVLFSMPSKSTAENQQNQAGARNGEALYKQKCAMCHDNPVDRVPPLFLIRRRTAEDVITTLTSGVMKEQARGLDADQILAIAIYVTGKQPGPGAGAPQNTNICKASGKPINLNGPQWNGWGRDLDNTRYQPTPGLKPEDLPKLKVKWAFAYPGTIASGQPVIIGDRLFATSETGHIYSLNAQTGCSYWETNAGAGVRTAVSIGRLPAGSPARFAVFFGDEKSTVHALDAETGKPIWKTKIEDHVLSRITGSPVLYRNRIYVPVSSYEESAGRDAKYECCKFRGSVVALDTLTGKVIWKGFAIPTEPKPFKKNSAGTQMFGPAGAAIWSAPTIDLKRNVIYAATGNSYTDVENLYSDAIVAFDLATGKIKWASQVTPKDNFLVGCRQPGVCNCPEGAGPDHDFGSSPILRTLPNGKQVLLIGQKSGVIYALDPDDRGKVLWQVKVGNGGALGGIEWGSAADAVNVYVPVADPSGAPDKRRPGLTALKIATGEQIWHVPATKPVCSWGTDRCNNAQSAATTVIPGVVFSGSMDGHLRGYATSNGAVIWDFDTAAKTYDAVNGMRAKGGSIDAAGPTIVNGMLFINSGYGRFVGQPGNVLLALSIDGK